MLGTSSRWGSGDGAVRTADESVSEQRLTYADKKRAGEAVDVDSEIEAWLEQGSPGSLAEWLGMSDEEYAAFVDQRMHGPDTVRDG